MTLHPLAAEAVDAINELSGSHPGHRAAHAKGTLLAGRFRATPAAAELTRAPHMQGGEHRATVRFSNGGGDPAIPDYAREGRGMAVKVYLDDGATTDMIGLTLPCFFVRTPEDFLEFTRARKDQQKAAEWVGAHQEALPAIQAALTMDPPASYASCVYNGLHSFRWIGPDGSERWVRLRWEPEEGEQSLDPDQAKERGPDYLQEEIAGRTGVALRLLAVLADEGDAIDDPTQPWPEEREKVEVARLEITGAEGEREQGDDVLVFDPTRVVDGIELSGDPILRFRPHAYAVSVERRAGAPPPASLPES